MEINEKIKEFAPIAEKMPGIVVIHRIAGFAPLYMSSNGLKLLGISLEELIQMGENYQKKVLNEDFMGDFLDFLSQNMQEKKDGDIYSFFHQVQHRKGEAFQWYVSSLKVFHYDSKGHPSHTLTIAFPLGDLKHIPRKAERMLSESLFYKKNQQKFHSLGNRAKEVLRLVALGKSSVEIAEELHISVDTVNTHKRLVKQKLNISSAYQFTKYAHSFDLI